MPSSSMHSPDQVYCRLLFTKNKKGGYPLWIPEPNKALPRAYRERGVNIGDVGLIADDGQFDYLFNICEEATHSVNGGPIHDNHRHGIPTAVGDNNIASTSIQVADADASNLRTPPGFSPVVLNAAKDIKEVEVTYPPGSDVSSKSMKRLKVLAEAGGGDPQFLHAGVGAGFAFECDKSEGATLFLPDGASSKDLLNLRKFRACAMKNAVKWYEYVVEELGRDVGNGSLILVTGCDKTVSWGIASYRDESRNTAVRLNFKAAEVVKGTASFVYHWETSSPATIRIGPLQFDGNQTQVVANRHQSNLPQHPGDGVPERVENQCVFIRGYSISIQEKLWRSLFGEGEVEVGLKKLQNAKPKDFNPPRSDNQSWPWLGGGGSNHGSPGVGQRRNTYLQADPPVDAIMDSDSDQSVPPSQMYHPSITINHYLLRSNPEALVALTHDDDWFAVLDKTDDLLPDEGILIDRISKMYTTINGPDGVYLERVLSNADSSPTVDSPSNVDSLSQGDFQSKGDSLSKGGPLPKEGPLPKGDALLKKDPLPKEDPLPKDDPIFQYDYKGKRVYARVVSGNYDESIANGLNAFKRLNVSVPDEFDVNLYIYLGKRPRKKVYITEDCWSEVTTILREKRVEVLYLERKNKKPLFKKFSWLRFMNSPVAREGVVMTADIDKNVDKIDW